MKETPFFFPNGSYNLFGILHEPKIKPNGEGFVFCHPFAEEKLWTHRVYVNFARELARLGYAVLRFDYMGHGDSEGKFEESSVETRLSDIQCAIKIVKEKTEETLKVNLIGLRLGATLAALTSELDPTINRLILWEPIINGTTYMRQMLRINLTTQTSVYKKIRHNSQTLIQMMKDGQTVNIDGYEVSWPLFDQIQQIDLLNQTKTYQGKTLIIQISPKNANVNKNIVSLKNLYQFNEVSVEVEKPFWKEIRENYFKADNLFHITLEWLKKT